MPYDEQNSYAKFNQGCNCGAESSSDCSCGCATDDCSCCPIGTVAVYDESGVHQGCLSPNDAELYEVGTHVPPTGFVKVIDSEGKYHGDLPPAQAIELLDFLDNGTTGGSAGDTFVVVVPKIDGGTGFYELNYTVAAGITNVINGIIDRNGVDESITVSIQNQPAGNPFEFEPSGTVLAIPMDKSDLDFQLKWTSLTAGTYTLILRFASTSVVREVPTRITLT